MCGRPAGAVVSRGPHAATPEHLCTPLGSKGVSMGRGSVQQPSRSVRLARPSCPFPLSPPHHSPGSRQTVRSAVAPWMWCSSSTAPRALATPTSLWRRTSSSTWSTGWGPSPRTPSRRQVSCTVVGWGQGAPGRSLEQRGRRAGHLGSRRKLTGGISEGWQLRQG